MPQDQSGFSYFQQFLGVLEIDEFGIAGANLDEVAQVDQAVQVDPRELDSHPVRVAPEDLAFHSDAKQTCGSNEFYVELTDGSRRQGFCGEQQGSPQTHIFHFIGEYGMVAYGQSDFGRKRDAGKFSLFFRHAASATSACRAPEIEWRSAPIPIREYEFVEEQT
jgi:hypothetical protein